MDLLKILFRKKKERLNMNYTQEHLEEVQLKYEYTCRQIQHLRENFNFYVRQSGNLAIADQSMNQLLVEKLRLEVENDMIADQLK